jgi:hypothetical protein
MVIILKKIKKRVCLPEITEIVCRVSPTNERHMY